MKQMSDKSSTSGNLELKWNRLQAFTCVAVISLGMAVFLERMDALPSGSSTNVLVGLLSAFFHVAYSYVSTGMVLSKLSVVSHAVANILKRVLVVLLLYWFGQRAATLNNFLGLAACTVGLFVYVWDKTRQTNIDLGATNNASDKNLIPGIAIRKRTWISIGISCICIISILAIGTQLTKRTNKAREYEIPSISWGHLPEQRKLFANEETMRMIQNSNHPAASPSFRSTFQADGQKKPTDEELRPKFGSASPDEVAEYESFLETRIINNPTGANFISEKLTQTSEVIREAQRLQFNLFEDILGKYKYAMIFDTASFENKGDPAITVGEIYLLQRLNIEVVYYCEFYTCSDRLFAQAREMAKNYNTDELVILAHGGGNIIGYPEHDVIRFKLMKLFSTYQMMMFPQSIYIKDPQSPHVKDTINTYCCHPNITLVLRDHLSYSIAQKFYQGTSKLALAPDMAFQIGKVERFMSPVFDVIWLKRIDTESPVYTASDNVPSNLRVHISDWYSWLTPQAGGNAMEKAFYVATNGFFFLQRGRVIITDRLHGHILATLMDIPHVLIDNKHKKLSSYHYSWTRSVENTILTDDPSKALDLAIGLLHKYNDTLPPIAPFLNLREDFKPSMKGKMLRSYA